MKKYLFASTLFLASCVSTTNQKSTKPETITIDNTSENLDHNYKVYKLEGCEYIVVGYGNTKWGSHKGNCSNPIHKTH